MSSVAVSPQRWPLSTYSQKAGLLAAQPPCLWSLLPRAAGADQAAACGVPGELDVQGGPGDGQAAVFGSEPLGTAPALNGGGTSAETRASEFTADMREVQGVN